MSITISPTTSTSVASTAPTTQAGATQSVGSGSAAVGSGATIALAFQQVDTGPLGLRRPGSAADMAALLSEVEMELDQTNTATRSNGLANGLQHRRVGLLEGLTQLTSAQAALTTDQGTLTAAQGTLSADRGTLTAAQDTLTTDQGQLTTAQGILASDQSTLASDQSTLAIDQHTLATDQAAKQQLVDQSAQLGTTIGSLRDQAAGLDAQIATATANDPNADVSTLTAQRDAHLEQASQDQSAKQDLDTRAAGYDSVIADDQAAVAADTTAVSTASRAVAADTEAVATVQAAVAADTEAVTTAQAAVAAGIDAVATAQSHVGSDAASLAAASQAVSLAFGRLASTLQTGDGQISRNATRSVQLDLGFQTLERTKTAIETKAGDRTVRSNAALDTLHAHQADRKVEDLAAGVAAGLAQVQAALAALKQQTAPSASPRVDRLRLSL